MEAETVRLILRRFLELGNSSAWRQWLEDEGTEGHFLGERGHTNTPERKSSSAADWRLLLQLDTDNDAGMMWGDTGVLYFWIREQDARAKDFSKVWVILQSC